MIISRTSATVLLIAAWALLSAAVKLSGNPVFWGLLPLGTGAAWLVLPGTLAVLVVASAVLAGKSDSLLKTAFKPNKVLSRLLVPVSLVLITAAAWFCRSHDHFMGDGFAFLTNVRSDFFLRDHEPLDFFLHQLIYRLLSQAGITDPQYAYWLPHVALLPFYLAVLWKISCHLSESRIVRTAVFALLCSAGSMQLFFGYVESYTFLNLTLALYFLAALKWSAEKTPSLPLVPTGLLILASALHFAAAAMVPSLLYLWLEAVNRRGSSAAAGLNALLVIGLSALAGLAVIRKSGGVLTVPLVAGPETVYTLFDTAHLLDKFNFLVFSFPALIVAGPVIIWQSIRLFTIPDRRLAFIMISALGAVGFAFAFEPLLGIRDWDIFAMTAVPLVMLGAMAFIICFGDKQSVPLLAMLALGSFAQLGSMLWMNTAEYRGVAFLERTLPAERHRDANLAQLGFLALEKNYEMSALKLLEGVRGGFVPRAHFSLAFINLDLGRPERTIKYLEPMHSAGMDQAAKLKLLQLLTMAYDLSGQPEKANVPYFELINFKYSPDEGAIQLWHEQLELAAMRNRYWVEFRKEAPSTAALIFLIRYYSVNYDNTKLPEIYRKVLDGSFTPEQWESFIRMAMLSGHDVERFLITQASYQHPGQAARFAALQR